MSTDIRHLNMGRDWKCCLGFENGQGDWLLCKVLSFQQNVGETVFLKPCLERCIVLASREGSVEDISRGDNVLSTMVLRLEV